MYDVKAIKNR